jgi:hypothetical protein
MRVEITDLERLLAEIEARANAATPEPWVYSHGNEIDHWELFNPDEAVWVVQDDSDVEPSTANLEFIAHSRQDVPRLVAALRKAVEQRGKAYLCSWDKPYCEMLAEDDAELAAILNPDKE